MLTWELWTVEPMSNNLLPKKYSVGETTEDPPTIFHLQWKINALLAPLRLSFSQSYFSRRWNLLRPTHELVESRENNQREKTASEPWIHQDNCTESLKELLDSDCTACTPKARICKDELGSYNLDRRASSIPFFNLGQLQAWPDAPL